MKKRSHGFRELIDDFGLWSSAKGPAHVPLTSAIWLKLFWFVIAVATTAGFLYMLIFELLKTYFSYPVNVDTQVRGKKFFESKLFRITMVPDRFRR